MQLIKQEALIQYANDQKSGSITANDIARFPTVEADPVVHGKWEFGETLHHPWMKCSACNVSQSGHTSCFSFCPNCGAHMDAGDFG